MTDGQVSQQKSIIPGQGTTATDRTLAWLVAAMAAALYMRSAAPDLLPGDSGEFQTAAWRFGLAHATGYPLYLMLGGLWQHLLSFFGVTPAYSLNLLSGLLGGLAIGLLYHLMMVLLPGERMAPRRIAALLTATFFATNPTWRTQVAVAEVYALHLLLLLAVLVTAAEIIRRPAGDERGWPQLGLLLGLALTHHATTALLAPPLALWLWRSGRRPVWQQRSSWLALGLLLGSALLYLYIPLRSGPAASPWYHQALGAEVLTLYDGSWRAFFDFITGRSISVGWFGLGEAMAQLPNATLLWLRHLELPGIVLVIAGIYTLVWQRQGPFLLFTVIWLVLGQVFNLFYAIGDIFVYYLPLYLVATLWMGWAAYGIGLGFGLVNAPDRQDVTALIPMMLAMALFAIPLQFWNNYGYLAESQQMESRATRDAWEAILAAPPPAQAILVSNDRNEIVPLFYLQNVEGRGGSLTGLFPLIQPGSRFANVRATVETALAADGDRPVALVKPMPGLNVRFAIEEQSPLPLVTGPAVDNAASAVDLPAEGALYGPLRLRQVTQSAIASSDSVTLTVGLTWQVNEPLGDRFTTTVQLFAADGSKLGQSDLTAGGDYYPTPLWQPGETLVERHQITLPAGERAASLLVGMYPAGGGPPLAPMLTLPLMPE
jgi:hypothetical protein